jgi:hypothetical protein
LNRRRARESKCQTIEAIGLAIDSAVIRCGRLVLSTVVTVPIWGLITDEVGREVLTLRHRRRTTFSPACKAAVVSEPKSAAKRPWMVQTSCMEPCVLCGATDSGVTREHVIPQWTRRSFDIRSSGTGTWHSRAAGSAAVTTARRWEAWLTPKDAIAVYGGDQEELYVYDSYSDFATPDWPEDLIAEVAGSLGEKYVEELDI